MADLKPFAGLSQEESTRPLLRRALSVLSAARNALGQLRVSVDNTPNVSVTNTPNIGTVTTVANTAAVGGYSANLDQLNACRSARAGIRSRIS
jgi:hypothetical protein